MLQAFELQRFFLPTDNQFEEGATPLRITTLSIMTLRIAIPSIMTLRIMIFRIMILRITVQSIKLLRIMASSINDTQDNDTSKMALRIMLLWKMPN
jgi:hypothetical protein